MKLFFSFSFPLCFEQGLCKCLHSLSDPGCSHDCLSLAIPEPARQASSGLGASPCGRNTSPGGPSEAAPALAEWRSQERSSDYAPGGSGTHFLPSGLWVVAASHSYSRLDHSALLFLFSRSFQQYCNKWVVLLFPLPLHIKLYRNHSVHFAKCLEIHLFTTDRLKGL